MPQRLAVTVLGTGSTAPTLTRWHPGIVVSFSGENFLFDCGEGCQIRLQQARINPMRISNIFLTHFHPDHFLGLGGLLSSISLNKRKEKITINCPKGSGKKIRDFVYTVNSSFSFKIAIREIPLSRKKKTVFENEECEILAVKVAHSVPALAYLFSEKDRFHFHPERLLAQPSSAQEFERIKAKLLKTKRKEFFTIERGRKVAYSGDTAPCEQMVELAKGCDLLIHESTFDEEFSHKAKEYLHSTARDAAKVAKLAGAKKLVLTHFSKRFTDHGMFEAEAIEVFRNSVEARDLDVFEV